MARLQPKVATIPAVARAERSSEGQFRTKVGYALSSEREVAVDEYAICGMSKTEATF